MATKRQNKKQDLMDAAVRLVAKNGVRGTTVRSIAREAGVTEGALYRHYASKAELYLDIYTRIVTDMIRAKQAIASGEAPVRDKLREWVRVSYEFFDQHPDAFTFVLLTPHEFTETERQIAALQGLIFTDLVERAQASGELRHMLPELALSHFSGVMLSVSRLINEGVLEGPASRYADDVAATVWRILEPETSRRGLRPQPKATRQRGNEATRHRGRVPTNCPAAKTFAADKEIDRLQCRARGIPTHSRRTPQMNAIPKAELKRAQTHVKT